MKPAKIMVVIPTYNEAENITQYVERLFKVGVPNLRLVAVDDNSPDGTGDILDTLAKKRPIEVVHRSRKTGYGSACLAGIRAALKQNPDRVIQMDADLSHDPRVIPRMLRQDADLVIGSRYIPGGRIEKWETWRRILSRMANLYARQILNLKIKDATTGYRCWKPEALTQILKLRLDSAGYVFLPETAYYASQLGFSISEVPITFTQRVTGISKLSWHVFFESCIKILKISSTEPPSASETSLPDTPR